MYHFHKIKTTRFLVKSLNLRNVNKRYFSWFKDPVIKKYITTSNSVNLGGIKSLKLYVRKKTNKKKILFLGIFTKKKTHIGNIKFEPISKKKKTAVVGFLIGDKKWRGKGVLKEIFPKILKYLYEYIGILRVELAVSPDNRMAIISYKKIGFRKIKSCEARLINKSKNTYAIDIYSK